MDILGRGLNVTDIKNTVENAYSRTKNTTFEKKVEASVAKKDGKELKKVCSEFEAMMLQVIYKQMKSTIPESELIPESMGHTVFESMLDEKLMEEATRLRGTGLAEMLYKQLIRQQNSSNFSERSDFDKEI